MDFDVFACPGCYAQRAVRAAAPGMHAAVDNDFGRVLRIAGPLAEAATMGHFLLLDRVKGKDVAPAGGAFLHGFITIGKSFDPRPACLLILPVEKGRFGGRDRIACGPVCERDFLLEVGLVLGQTRVHDEVAVGGCRASRDPCPSQR